MKVLLLALVLLGCEKDPYPSNGTISDQQREEQRDVPDPIAMTVEQKYDFDEGKRSSFKVGVFVQSPGLPDLTVKNLPEGAEFDPETFTISWMPGPYQGNDLKDPTKKTRVYNIELLLRNSRDIDGDTRTARVTLVVNDVPRKFEINGSTRDTVYEGQTLTYDFEMDSIDYPQGPFAVNAADMPANTEIVQLSDKKYRLVFKPDYHHVKLNRNSSVEYDTKLSVYNPANHLAEKLVNIKVLDRRLGVKLVTPPEMEQGLDTTFQVSAYDLNAEVAPRIELVGQKPAFGEFKTNIVKDETNNSSVLNVTWKDIPPSYNGKRVSFRFKACVLQSRGYYNRCETKSTTLKIRVKDRKPPVISRWSWPSGDIKYLKHNERVTFNINAEDGDNGEDIQDLVVMPESMRKYVRFSYSRRGGRITVQCDKPGFHEFSLIAKSEYNMTTAESFVFEVFKKQRSETLYFTDSTRDEEVRFFRENLGSVELMNPKLTILNDRILAGRETLVLGTSALLDTHMQEEIRTGIDEIKNIIIASPMVENLPKEFLEMIEDKLKITVIGRYSELPIQTKLEDLTFVARPDFTRAKEKVGLRGTSSSASSDPVVFHEGVLAEKCDDVLELSDEVSDQRKSYSIGIICTMPNRGRLALLGTEFADIKGAESEKDIGAKWFKDMLNKRVSQ